MYELMIVKKNFFCIFRSSLLFLGQFRLVAWIKCLDPTLIAPGSCSSRVHYCSRMVQSAAALMPGLRRVNIDMEASNSNSISMFRPVGKNEEKISETCTLLLELLI